MVNIVPLICEVEDVDVGSVHLSANVHNLCLILNVQLEFTGVILQVLNLNKQNLTACTYDALQAINRANLCKVSG